MVGRVAADFVDIREFFELAHDLIEADIFADAQPDATARRVGQRQAEDAIHVEGAACEEAHDMGHDARMIRDGELENGVHIYRCAGVLRDLGFMRA